MIPSSNFNQFIIKIFIYFWLIVVIIECADLNKRDVVHRIILKSSNRRPRSQKNHHHTHHLNAKNHRGKHGRHREEHDDSRYSSEEASRESRRNRSPEDLSRENSREVSRENRETSYEESYENTRYEDRPLRQKHYKSNRLNGDYIVEESRLPTPVKIKHNKNIDWDSSEEISPKLTSKRRPKKYRTPIIDFTTSFPIKPPLPIQSSSYELYPPIPSYQSNFQNFENPHVTFNTPFPVIQPKPTNHFTNYLPIQLNNNLPTTSATLRNSTYEVRENIEFAKNNFKKPSSIAPTSFQKIGNSQQDASPSNVVNILHTSPTNGASVVSTIKEDFKKLSTTPPTKRWRKTKG